MEKGHRMIRGSFPAHEADLMAWLCLHRFLRSYVLLQLGVNL